MGQIPKSAQYKNIETIKETLSPFPKRPSGQVPGAPKVLPLGSQVFTLVSRSGFSHPHARIHVELLGPCFKTGR